MVMLDHGSAIRSGVLQFDQLAVREATFQSLFPFNPHAQMSIAIRVVSHALPVVERRRRKLEWARQLLANPAQWVETNGRAYPFYRSNKPVMTDFIEAIDAILLGQERIGEPVTVTSSSVVAMEASIRARMLAVWDSDNPNAVETWKSSEDAATETVWSNEPALAVWKREWLRVADEVDMALSDHGSSEQGVDKVETERSLTIWRAYEYNLIVHPLDEP